jgi:hypothetical protein
MRRLEPLPRLRNRRNGVVDDAQRRSREQVHERVKRLDLLGRESGRTVLLERGGGDLRHREFLLELGIVAGMSLSFARGLGEFGATITFVSNIPCETQTLPTAIYMLRRRRH